MKQELKLYKKDKFLFSSVTIVPLVLFLFLINIFGDGVVKNLPIGIVDLDETPISREFVRMLDASDKMSLKLHLKSPNEAFEAVKKEQIYGFVVIHKNFYADILKGNETSVSVFYNTQFILVGNTINAALNQIFLTFKTKLIIGKQLSLGNTPLSLAYNSSLKINQQITPLYNNDLNYKKFLLSVIIPSAWQIFLVATMILNLIAHNRFYGLNTLTFKAFLNKIFIHQIIFFIFLIGFNLYLKTPLNALVLAFGYFCILASEALAFGIYFLTLNSTLSLSFAASFTAPCLAFAGVTFPISDMSAFAKTWSFFLPITHYLIVQISQFNYLEFFPNYWIDFAYLLGFNALFCVMILKLKTLKTS